MMIDFYACLFNPKSTVLLQKKPFFSKAHMARRKAGRTTKLWCPNKPAKPIASSCAIATTDVRTFAPLGRDNSILF